MMLNKVYKLSLLARVNDNRLMFLLALIYLGSIKTFYTCIVRMILNVVCKILDLFIILMGAVEFSF